MRKFNSKLNISQQLQKIKLIQQKYYFVYLILDMKKPAETGIYVISDIYTLHAAGSFLFYFNLNRRHPYLPVTEADLLLHFYFH